LFLVLIPRHIVALSHVRRCRALQRVLQRSSETVSSGGIVSGATVADTPISGGEVDVLSGGKLTFATVSSGGDLTVSKGGSAASIVVSSGGNLNVAGTTSNVTVLNGGTETASSGGVASGTSISSIVIAGEPSRE
jgi:autotransporter passenger strand-loop-strand repeat protein